MRRPGGKSADDHGEHGAKSQINEALELTMERRGKRALSLETSDAEGGSLGTL